MIVAASRFAGVAVNHLLAMEVAYMYTPELTATEVGNTGVTTIRLNQHLAALSLILGSEITPILNLAIRHERQPYEGRWACDTGLICR